MKQRMILALLLILFVITTAKAMAVERLERGSGALTTKVRVAKPVAKSRDWPVFAVMSVGADFRGERDQAQSTVPRTWPTISFGLGLRPWLAMIEYGGFTESSGNSSLNIVRRNETVLLWGYWMAPQPWNLQPYVGIGLGGYKTSADLSVYEQKATEDSRWREHAAVALGAQWKWANPFWLSGEVRLHTNPVLDPNPMLAGAIKMGFLLK